MIYMLLGIMAFIYSFYLLVTNHLSMKKTPQLIKNKAKYIYNEALVFLYWGIVLVVFHFFELYFEIGFLGRIILIALLVVGLIFRVKNNHESYY